jgi:hypothetical protein
MVTNGENDNKAILVGDAYARTTAAMATTRPPKEMALPEAAPTDCSGREELLVGLPAPPDVAAGELLGATAPVLLTTAVELTPGTMGTTREVGAMGVAVGTTGVSTAGVVTVVMLTYDQTCRKKVPKHTSRD